MFISKTNRRKVQKTLHDSGFLWTLSLSLDRLGLRLFRFWPDKRINPEILSSQITAILRSMGMEEMNIEITEKHILYSDIHGIDSHGCGMLKHYYRLHSAGSLRMNPKIEIVRETETTALIDGGGGLGHVPADIAMKLAIKKCESTGVGVVTVRNSGHFGAAGTYASMASQADLIGQAMTNVPQPALVPTFGLTSMLGTNPIAFSAPATSSKPFLLDMATTIVPVGKLIMAWRKGLLIPRGWAFNDLGKSLKQPGRVIKHRRLIPLGGTRQMGGHKGYGLAAMVEILSSRLSGNNETSNGVGHFFLALDPAEFGEIADFKKNVEEMMNSLRSSKAKRADNPVQVAGDPEYAAAADRKKNGIPLTRCVIEDIRYVCEATGARFLLDPKQ
jgi:LDH2 family malate/lactate/ureidoglycolate dehydrogenase